MDGEDSTLSRFSKFYRIYFLQEMQVSMIPAMVSLGITAILACLNRGGLFTGVLGGCVSYYLLSAVLA